MMLAFLFANSFAYVTLKALQQKNVQGGHYIGVGPISFGMAFCEVYGITAFVTSGESKWLAALAIGSGGWLGCVVAMWAHDKIRKISFGRVNRGQSAV